MTTGGAEGCVFCRIVAGSAAADVVYEDDTHLAFLPLEHINPGHVLVIPKRHVDYLFDLDGEHYVALWRVAARLAPGLRNATAARRIAVAVEGFSVPHVHVHLVPVHHGDELDPGRAVRLSDEQTRHWAEQLRRAFAGEARPPGNDGSADVTDAASGAAMKT